MLPVRGFTLILVEFTLLVDHSCSCLDVFMHLTYKLSSYLLICRTKQWGENCSKFGAFWGVGLPDEWTMVIQPSTTQLTNNTVGWMERMTFHLEGKFYLTLAKNTPWNQFSLKASEEKGTIFYPISAGWDSPPFILRNTRNAFPVGHNILFKWMCIFCGNQTSQRFTRASSVPTLFTHKR